ncbi:MAG TPA: TolC family protein [Candidatus Acidoferrum sp.]|jgi:outer membrane protein TolC|nr:TolC family protein [Candidatus Acidoferrum sp.]
MRLFRILSALVGASTLTLAQTNPPVEVRQLSLQDCIELALKRNLDLQIGRYGPKISLFNLNAAYGAFDPSLNLSGQHQHSESGDQLLAGGFVIPGSKTDANSFSSSVAGTSPIGTTYTVQGNASDTYGNSGANQFENSVGSASFHLTQPLLKNFWIDNNRLTIRVAKNRLKYSGLVLKLQVMQTITKLEQAYYDLIYDQENVIVQKKAVELAERLVAENKKRLEVGALAPLDLQSAEAQAASTRAQVILAQSQLGTQERVVKQLITDQFREWADVPLEPTGKLKATPPVVNRQDSWGKGLTERPELLQARLDVEKQGIQLKYDKNQLYPELDGFFTYGYNGTGREFSDALNDVQQADKRFYTYGGQITIPLANIRARNSYRADRASMEQLVLTLKQLEQNIMIAIDNDIGTILANFDQVQATRTAREYEESALEAEQKKLESGKSTTYTVLQVQRDLTTARGNEIQALDNYLKSLSQLSIDEGSTLNRLDINFEAN